MAQKGGRQMRNTIRSIAIAATAVAVAVTVSSIATATPSAGGSVTVLTRGTVGPIHETSESFKLFQKNSADFVTISYQLAPGGTLGWHTHPGPALITVSSG